MRLSIDLQGAQTEDSRHRGIGRYTLSFAKALLQLDSPHRFEFFLNGHYPEAMLDIKASLSDISSSIQWHEYIYPVGNNAHFRKVAQVLVSHTYAKTRPELLHISSPFEGLAGKGIPPFWHNISPDTLTSSTLYDLIPYIFKERALTDKNTCQWYYQQLNSLKNCDLLLTISTSTRNDAIDYLGIEPDNIINISAAAAKQFRPLTLSRKTKEDFFHRFGLSEQFILYIGCMDYGKNIKNLVNAYARLSPRLRKLHPLVIAGNFKPAEKQALHSLVRQSGLLPDEIIFTGFVKDEDLIIFYNLCHLFIFPSLYEGFGFPALEAMSCGAPVIGANTSSIPEIINFKEALFNPHSPDDIAACLIRTLEDDDFRKTLSTHGLKQAKHFSWEKTAKAALSAFEAAKERKKPTSMISSTTLIPRYKIAYFSPLPSQRSGIADYSAALLPYLSKYFDIDLYSHQTTSTDPFIHSSFSLFHWKDFEHRAQDYDVLLYHIGNSEYHDYMIDMLSRYPGIVVLHDFFLSGLMRYIETKHQHSNFFDNELFYSHGNLSKTKHTWEEKVMAFPANLRVLENAQQLITHSTFSNTLAEKFYGSHHGCHFETIPMMQNVYALPSDSEKNTLRKQLGFSEQDLLIVSFGFLGHTKLNDVILNAFLQCSLKNLAQIKLIFVGECLTYTEYGKALLSSIQQSGIQEKILITGYCDTSTYESYLAIGDIAIQLRTHSRGETSAAVLKCLAAGMPVIVNDYATFKDYPDEVVMKIPEDANELSLIEALEKLIHHSHVREQYKKQAIAYIKSHHHPLKIAAHYATAIHQSLPYDKTRRKKNCLKELANILSQTPHTENELKAIEKAVSDIF